MTAETSVINEAQTPPEQTACRRFAHLRRLDQLPDVRMSGLRQINSHLLASLIGNLDPTVDAADLPPLVKVYKNTTAIAPALIDNEAQGRLSGLWGQRVHCLLALQLRYLGDYLSLQLTCNLLGHLSDRADMLAGNHARDVPVWCPFPGFHRL